jgi:NADH-quinone oxidoreductase subunit L
LEPIFGSQAHHGSVSTELLVTLLTLAVVTVGIYLAYLMYGKPGPQPVAEASSGIFYDISLNKYYVDEVYDFIFVRPFTAVAKFFASIVDPWVIDGLVNGVAATARGFSTIWRGLQTGNVQHYAAMFLVGVLALIAYYLGQLS